MSRIGPICPLVPPRNTASGAGRSVSASGAMPSTILMFHAPNLLRFVSMRPHPSGLVSTAKVFPPLAMRASSTVTLPVPAPTSQTVSPGFTARRPAMALLTSCLVIGTFPLTKRSSGIPGTGTLYSGSGSLSASTTARTSGSMSFASSAGASVIFSFSYDRFSPIHSFRLPSPASVSCFARSAGPSSPPVRKNVFFPR